MVGGSAGSSRPGSGGDGQDDAPDRGRCGGRERNALQRPPPGPSRREAVKLLLGGALVSGALARGVEAGSGRGDVLVGDLAEIPAGSAVPARFHGLPVLVIHLEDGPVVLSALCTHEGCMVAWERGRKELVCPCHEGRFGGGGEVLGGPPPAPLLNFPVRVEDGKIYVVE